MFWVVDNFLMRKHRLSRKVNKQDNPIQYVKNAKQLPGISDDEVNLHLISNESNDTLIDDVSGPEYESLHDISESLSR